MPERKFLVKWVGNENEFTVNRIIEFMGHLFYKLEVTELPNEPKKKEEAITKAVNE